MLAMMSELLAGTVPNMQDIHFVQSSILDSLDIYKPKDLVKQLLQTGIDVGARSRHAWGIQTFYVYYIIL